MARLSFVIPLGAIAIVALGQMTGGQVRTAPPNAAGTPSAWTAPRTPDGHPDLQGMWTNGTLTPFERPAAQAEKPFLTEEEATAIEQRSGRGRGNSGPARVGGAIGGDNEAFMDTGYKVTSTRQSSLVVDPPNGRVVIKPDAEKRRDFNLNSTDDFESLSPWDRCITRGPTPLFPANYNNAAQIIQTPGYVVIVSEMIHEARIVPTNGSSHPDSRVQSWSGDSRGRWEGATLVVDTTNFNGKGWITTHAGSGRLRGTPYSEKLHLVETFTRVSANTLIYTMKIDDPDVYETPWTVSIPFTRDDSYLMYEYACHEGNQATELILRGARTLEREATTGSQK